MALEDIIKKFQLKRVNPFQGLVIDADTWQDAHNYHRDLQRLHLLAFHKNGIVEGLEVTASSPPDLSVNINPGIAIDPDGNLIIVAQTQRYRLQSRKTGTIYLIIQFREVPEGPYQPPDGGQPTRLIEAYKIEERDKLPTEPYIELARIDFDPTEEAIRNPKNPAQPAKNEIGLSARQELAPAPIPPAPPVKKTAAAPAPAAPEVTPAPRESILIGHAALGGAGKGLNTAGLKNLVKDINRQGDVNAALEEDISLEKDLTRFTVIYLTGSSRFELTEENLSSLGGFLESGGVIFGEGSFEGQEEAESKGAKEFGLAFNQLASQLKRKLEIVQRGHALLSGNYLFSEVPAGAEAGMLLEGGNMIYSGSDYGKAWQGGPPDKPLSRDIIRSSFEIGANIVFHARTTKAAGR